MQLQGIGHASGQWQTIQVSECKVMGKRVLITGPANLITNLLQPCRLKGKQHSDISLPLCIQCIYFMYTNF